MINTITPLPKNYLCSIEREYRILINAAKEYSGISYMDGSIISEIEEFIELLKRDKRDLQRRLSELKGTCVHSHKEGKSKADQIELIEEMIETLEEMDSSFNGILYADL